LLSLGSKFSEAVVQILKINGNFLTRKRFWKLGSELLVNIPRISRSHRQ